MRYGHRLVLYSPKSVSRIFYLLGVLDMFLLLVLSVGASTIGYGDADALVFVFSMDFLVCLQFPVCVCAVEFDAPRKIGLAPIELDRFGCRCGLLRTLFIGSDKTCRQQV